LVWHFFSLTKCFHHITKFTKKTTTTQCKQPKLILKNMYFHQPSYKGKAGNNKHHTYLGQQGSLGHGGARMTQCKTANRDTGNNGWAGYGMVVRRGRQRHNGCQLRGPSRFWASRAVSWRMWENTHVLRQKQIETHFFIFLKSTKKVSYWHP